MFGFLLFFRTDVKYFTTVYNQLELMVSSASLLGGKRVFLALTAIMSSLVSFLVPKAVVNTFLAFWTSPYIVVPTY